MQKEANPPALEHVLSFPIQKSNHSSVSNDIKKVTKGRGNKEKGERPTKSGSSSSNRMDTENLGQDTRGAHTNGLYTRGHKNVERADKRLDDDDDSCQLSQLFFFRWLFENQSATVSVLLKNKKKKRKASRCNWRETWAQVTIRVCLSAPLTFCRQAGFMTWREFRLLLSAAVSLVTSLVRSTPHDAHYIKRSLFSPSPHWKKKRSI